MGAAAQDPADGFRRANELHRGGDREAARAAAQAVLEVAPRHADALHLLGLIAAQSRDLPLALALFDRALESDPRHAFAHGNRGTVLQELGQRDAALAAYDAAIACKADHAVAHNNRGNLLSGSRQWDAALAGYDKAIDAQPDFAVAWSNRGHVLKQLGRWDAALMSHDTAIALKPDFAEAFSNRGLVYEAIDRPEQALRDHDRAIELSPAYADAWVNRGNVLKALQRWTEAFDSYERALAIDPEHAEAHFNKAIALLARGEWRHGWAEYEWRWRQRGTAVKQPRGFAQPVWRATLPLDGKAILVHCEQGLGDTLQFCRYAQPLARRGARVILEVQPPLMGVLAGLAGVTRLVAEGEALPDFDCHCALLSLPLAFGTTLETLPAPATIVAQPPRVAAWRARLGARSGRCVGLMWRGNADHANDRNRSIALADWLRHLPGGFHYVSLQKEALAHERPVLAAHAGKVSHDDKADFEDTAAACACVELVISVDTSVAHLSASMGRNTWIVLPTDPDWRWLGGRSDSPWYPSVTLHRQSRRGEWGDVVRGIADGLTRAFA